MKFEQLMPLIAAQLWRVNTLNSLSYDALSDWFAFYWNRQTTSVALGKYSCRGVAVIKFFSRLAQMDEDYVHEPDGIYCQVEALSIAEPAVLKALFDDIARRWGTRRIVLWSRGKRDRLPRLYSWDQTERLVRKFASNEPALNS